MNEGHAFHSISFHCLTTHSDLTQVIDFGSSCFVDDHLSSYVQSRSYRAPEVGVLKPLLHRCQTVDSNIFIYIYIYASVFRVNLPPHMVPPDPGPRPTVPPLVQGCLPSIFAFIPALSQIPCKYHAIQLHVQ